MNTGRAEIRRAHAVRLLGVTGVFLWSVLYPASAARAGEIRKTAANYLAIGQSTAEDAAIAGREACQDARKTLIGSVFGEVVQINQNSVRSLGFLDYSEDAQVSSERVQLVGWRQELQTERNSTICRIFYPIEESEIEKQRLKGRQGQANTRYTEIGNSKNDFSGVLEVVTFPDNAAVYINHERWGTTPLRLTDKLKPGQQLLRIERDNFDPVEEWVEIRPGTKTHVSKLLKRSTANLTIVTQPEGARVIVNGQSWGTSPTKTFKVLSGQPLDIDIQHDETHHYHQTLTLSRNENYPLRVELPMKPARLSFHVEPREGVRAELDGRPIKSWTRLQIPPGRHSLIVRKDGYREEIQYFEARGDENVVLKTIELKVLTEPEVRLRRHIERLKNPHLIVSTGLQLAGSSFDELDYGASGWFVSAATHAKHGFDLMIQFDNRHGVVTYKNAEISISQNKTAVLASYTLRAQSNMDFIFMAGLGQIDTLLSVEGQSSVKKLKQKTHDFGLKYRVWRNDGLFPAAFAVGTMIESTSKTPAAEMSGSLNPVFSLEMSLGF